MTRHTIFGLELLTHKSTSRFIGPLAVGMLFLSAMIGGIRASATDVARWVDPRIGSEGLGRVFVGPAMPFGMVRPGPDCTAEPNSGWLPMPERVDGFSQVHVSGTGGGAKYGNILVQPFFYEPGMGVINPEGNIGFPQLRDSEEIELGRYSTTYQNGISTDITAKERATAFRFTFPDTGQPALLVDCGWLLGESNDPDGREAQHLVGSQVEIVNDTTVCGYSRVRGGWNNGRAYTVYFWAETSKPFSAWETFRGTELSTSRFQADQGDKTGAILAFPYNTPTVGLKIGISFISELKARENLQSIVGKNFETINRELHEAWEERLGRIEIGEGATDQQRRMFYTGLYHSLLMPSDRTGENPLWTSSQPYYDDFYALWDTYRTSFPLFLIIAPEREAEMINSLIDIWRHEGFMPDARSGNDNGRTQGGSTADIVIADAYVKGLQGVDYKEALKAMLADAESDPGSRHEANGRGGLRHYNRLGYVPFGIPRAGSRTVDYAHCDFAIAEVAEGLGLDSLAEVYRGRSHNWTNLWRGDYEQDGVKGFIMPRSGEGRWVDKIPFGHGRLKKQFGYTPTMFEGPWYTPWWDMFFYEASSWEYSLSFPHDVPRLIALCGGRGAFENRLDIFFDHGYFNVNNEPSFLTPMLYHWIGLPGRSSERVLGIMAENYSDGRDGLPGNDDSGATSSWLAFNMMGIYPNAGHDYYFIHTPVLPSSTIHLANGNTFSIAAEGLSQEKHHIVSASLNGKDYPYSTISHSAIMEGGKLILKMGSKPKEWGREMFPPSSRYYRVNGNYINEKAGITEDNFDVALSDLSDESRKERLRMMVGDSVLSKLPSILAPATASVEGKTLKFIFKLHGQTRRFQFKFSQADKDVLLTWEIERNLRTWRGSYLMGADALRSASEMSFLMPEDHHDIVLASNELFCMISREKFRELSTEGTAEIDGITYHLGDCEYTTLIRAVADNHEKTELWIVKNLGLPIVWRMERSPYEIDWTVEELH